MRLLILKSIVLSFLLAGCAQATSTAMFTPLPPTDTPVEVLSSIPYSDESPQLKLDVYLPPQGEAPFPTIMAIHGGGFYARDKAMYGFIGRYYARQGYAFVAINFRLAPAASYPIQVEDSFCALAWIHANHEEYGFDTDRVIVTGGSSGGYLASMVATVDDPNLYLSGCPHQLPSAGSVHAAIILYGLYDFTSVDDYPVADVNTYLADFWGAKHEDISVDRLEEMSPISQIDGSEVPFIIFHGTDDTAVPSVMSERFAEALEKSGVDVELILLPEVGHAFEQKPLDGPEMSLVLSRSLDFLDRVLEND